MSYEDQWGSFRSVVIPMTSPGGRTYLTCADYDIGYVSALLAERIWWSLGVASLFLVAGTPFILVFMSYGRRLNRLNLELAHSAATLERTVEERTHDLQAAKDAAEQADRSKSEFLAAMSHEVRTPLNAMLGMISLLKSRDVGQEHRRAVNLLDSSGRHLLTVVNDILDISRMDAGRMQLEAVPFDVRALLDEVCATCRADGCRVGIGFTVDAGLKPCRVGDPVRLRQVLLNLVGNALKFTEAGSVELEAGPSTMDGDDWLLLTVRDTGIGIPEDKLETIFERFSQVDGTTGHGGSGLGLTISRRLVQLMGGHIWCQSEVGRGATFRFTAKLPAKVACAPGECEPITTEDVDPASLPPARILVAEDFEPNYAMLEMLLENSPASTTRATNGREALDMVKQGGWDLVLMDIHMPLMDGLEAARAIRQWERDTGSPRVPIIALTADAMSDHQADTGPDGFDDVLLKPMSRQDLFAAIASQAGPSGDTQNAVGGASSAAMDKDVRELMPVFIRSMRQGMADLAGILAGPDAGVDGRPDGRKELVRLAHGLKGACLNYGFDELADVFAAMQDSAENNDREAVRRLLGEAGRHLETVSLTFGEDQP